MRALLAALLLVPSFAIADVPPAVDAEVASSPGPVLDAERLFNTTEVFHLEPADVRLELRYTSGAPDSIPTEELRAEVGITRHFQGSIGADVAQALGQQLQPTAVPVSVRYSLGANEGDILGNPAVEAEVVPRLNQPTRAGLRLLAGQEVVPHLVVAANAYVEQNLNRGTSAGVDGTLGMTGGASYGLLGDHLHLGVEGQVGAAQYGQPGYTLVMAAGPNMVGRIGPVAATVTALFDLTQQRIGFEPMATLGCTF